MFNTQLSYTHSLQKSIITMAKCNPFGHIRHIIGFIEMLCLNYFDLVTGNPTVCAILAALFSL